MPRLNKHFKVTGESLFLCDMRPGFSEDGVEVALPKGDYQLVLEPAAIGELVGFSLVLIGKIPTSKKAKGTFTLDMARVGIFDRKTLLKFFKGDGEALFEWSENVSDKKTANWGGSLKHGKSGLEALYVNVGSDCKCTVQLLQAKSRTIGVQVIPQQPAEHPDKKLGSRHWTWVEIKCQGIKGKWSFCNDRDYSPEFDEVLDNVTFEVSSIDEGDSLEFLDVKDIDADIAISKYRRRFRGVEKFLVFTEWAGESRKRLSIPASHSIAKLGAETTPKKLAEIIFELFQAARKWG